VRIYLVAAVSICGLHVAQRLFVGAYDSASLALLATIPVCAVGVIALAGLRLAKTAAHHAAELKGLRERLDVLEATSELLLAEVELLSAAEIEPAPTDPGVAATEQSTAESAASSGRIMRSSSPGERHNLSPVQDASDPKGPGAAALRERFVALLRLGDVEEAIKLGDDLSKQFPDSRMAADFASIRPRLLQRLEHAMTHGVTSS
jgi:hypothetical protein